MFMIDVNTSKAELFIKEKQLIHGVKIQNVSIIQVSMSSVSFTIWKLISYTQKKCLCFIDNVMVTFMMANRGLWLVVQVGSLDIIESAIGIFFGR